MSLKQVRAFLNLILNQMSMLEPQFVWDIVFTFPSMARSGPKSLSCPVYVLL